MNATSFQPVPAAESHRALADALRDYLLSCEDLLALMSAENSALRDGGEYQPFQFHQSRKGLLARLDRTLNALRHCAPAWRQSTQPERSQCPQVKSLLAQAQDMAVKVLVLDRENQQALLRRGLFPANAIPSAINPSPHFVTDTYRRHSAVRSATV